MAATMVKGERATLTALIRATLERHGRFAHAGDPCQVADAWARAGFDAGQVDAWLSARCFSPAAAAKLAAAELDPATLRVHTDAGRRGYLDSVGFKIATGELGIDEAGELIVAQLTPG